MPQLLSARKKIKRNRLEQLWSVLKFGPQTNSREQVLDKLVDGKVRDFNDISAKLAAVQCLYEDKAFVIDQALRK